MNFTFTAIILVFSIISAHPQSGEKSILIEELNGALIKGDYDRALEIGQEVVKIDPTDYQVNLTLGQLYQAKWERSKEAEYLQAAIDFYEAGLRQDGDDFDLNYSLGSLYYNEACSAFSELDLENNVVTDSPIEAHKYPQKVLEAFQMAYPYLKKAHQVDPDQSLLYDAVNFIENNIDGGEKEIDKRQSIHGHSRVRSSLGTPPNVTVLVDNEEHVIYYSVLEERLNITIEDKRDNEFNSYYHGSRFEPTNGNDFDNCTTEEREILQIEDKYARAYDVSLIEFDRNNNSTLEGVIDFGYHAKYRWRGQKNVFAHYLRGKYLPPYERELGGRAEMNKRSEANGEMQWIGTDVIPQKHLVYKFFIPLDELLIDESEQISFRVIVQRTAKRWFSDRPYGTFIYPDQTCEYQNSNEFFSIDIKEIAGSKVTKKTLQTNREFDELRADDRLKNEEYSKKQYSNRLDKLPLEDGLYIKIRQGGFIKLESYPAIFGALMDYKGRDYLDQSRYYDRHRTPFVLEKEFLQRELLRIKGADFDGYYLVAGDHLKEVVDWQSLHPVKFVVLESGKLKILQEPSSSEYITGPTVTNTNAYILGEQIPSVNTVASLSWSYESKLDFQLRPDIYGVWAGRYLWIFQIVE